MKFEKEKIFGFYKRLISLYPQSFREKFGESMEQTFNDLLNDRNDRFGFVVWIFAETSVGICKERISQIGEEGFMNKILLDPRFSALIAFILILPFFTLNMIAVNQIEPFSSVFKINTAGNFWDYPIGNLSGIIALLLFPAGAVIAIRAMIQNKMNRGTFYFINGILAFLMIAFFVVISWALLDEIYRCNVLLVRNCD